MALRRLKSIIISNTLKNIGISRPPVCSESSWSQCENSGSRTRACNGSARQLVNTGPRGPAPEARLGESGGARACAFLMDSQEMLTLLVWQAHFENHLPKSIVVILFPLPLVHLVRHRREIILMIHSVHTQSLHVRCHCPVQLGYISRQSKLLPLWNLPCGV